MILKGEIVMNTLMNDLRYAFRLLRKNPGVALVAILCLGLGIGANTTVFSGANALAFHPLPQLAAPDRLLMLAELPPNGDERFVGVAPATFADWRTAARSFEDLGAFVSWDVNVTGTDEPERVTVYQVTPSTFRLWGVRPALGRTFLDEEDQLGRHAVVVLGYGFWERRLGADPRVIGQTLRLNDQSYMVIGVMPRDFLCPPGAQLWTPLALEPAAASDRTRRSLLVFGRLKSGVTEAQARAEMSTIARRLAEHHPETNAGWGVQTQSMEAFYGRGPRPFMLLLLAAVGFVLLIACANVANLLLARATARTREIAVKIALGASRSRIVRQLLTESALLSLLGGLVGLLLSLWGITLMARAIPAELRPYITGFGQLTIDKRALVFTLGISLGAGLLFGLAPAIEASKPDLHQALKEGGRSAPGGRRQRLRNGLVVAEIALALMLLVSAGLMVQSFNRLVLADPGFRPEQVLTMRVTLPQGRYQRDERITDFYARLIERIESLPGVQSAGLVSILPMSWSERTVSLAVEGRPPQRPGEEPKVGYRIVSPEHFRAMSIPVIRGRIFDDRDSADAPRVAILSPSAVKRLFGTEDPVGRRIMIGTDVQPAIIVGIVRDVRHNALVTDEPQAAVYVPLPQAPRRTMSLAVRTTGDPASIAPAVRREITALDASLGASDVLTMERVVSSALSPQRVTTGMLSSLALIALILAATGIYAVMSFSVAQRTHEIGIRVALGAQRSDILGLVVGHGLRLTLIGVAIGLVGALALTRLLSRLLYGVSATDPPTFAVIALLLAGAALLACYIPARRATKVDPMVALRYE